MPTIWISNNELWHSLKACTKLNFAIFTMFSAKNQLLIINRVSNNFEKMNKFIPIFLLLIITKIGFSQNAGTVDSSFGTNGISEYTLTINETLYGVTLRDLFKLPDDKILAVGTANWGCSGTSYYSGLIMRLNSNGELDTSFHNIGYTLISEQSFYQIIPINNNELYLISINGIFKTDLDGNLDNSYGVDGFSELYMNCNSAVLNSTGDLYVSTRKSSGYTPLITKLTSVGSVDTSFGNNGEVTFPHDYQFSSMALNSNEDLLIIGREFISYPNTKLLVIKMNSSGVLDSTFANQGIFEYQTASNSYGNEIYIDDNDNIFGAGSGTLTNSSGLGMILFRLLPNGDLDSTFNGNGITSIPIYSDSSPRNIHKIENEGFIISGNGYNNMFVTKVNEDGYIDLSFGIDGKIITPTFDWTGFNSTSLLVDNTILICGNSAFAHCGQQRYMGVLTKYFISDSSLSANGFSNSAINLFPNPTKGKIHIPKSSNEIIYKFYSSSGKELKPNYILNASENLTQIDISNFAKGVYFLIIESQNVRKVKKIIKD